MTQTTDVAEVGTVEDRLIDHIAGIGQAARTVIAHRESMTSELRTEVLGLLYDRAFELHRFFADLDQRRSKLPDTTLRWWRVANVGPLIGNGS